MNPRRRPAQRPAAPAMQSFAYGSPGTSSSSIALAAATADQEALKVIAAGISTARRVSTTKTKLSTVSSNPVDPDDSNSDSEESLAGSPTASPIGSRPASPVRGRLASSAGVRVQTSKGNVGRDDSLGGSGSGSGALTGNGTPMGEGFSRNFGTEGPVGGNVGLGNTPVANPMAYPSLRRSHATSASGLRATSLPVATVLHSAGEGGSLSPDTTPRPAKASENPSADSSQHTTLPELTENQFYRPDGTRQGRTARDLRRRRHEEQGYNIWAEPVCANMAKVLIFVALAWVAYQALKAAGPGFRWASDQFQSQTASLKQNGAFVHSNNTAWPHPTLNGITTNQYNDIMARLTTIQNSYDSLSAQGAQSRGPSRVNYVSRGLGAIIDPHLTSPTRKLTVRSRSWFGLSSYELRTPDPVTALLPWDDIGDCWCAPRAGGKSQLTVLLPRKIVPTHLVIEHIPHGATLDIGSAPKDVELWVQIKDPEARVRVMDATMAVPSLAEESLLAARTLPDYGTDTALDKSWIRVGRWEYDIFAANHVQDLAVPVELDHFQVAVNKVSVRVRRNWGMKDYTCLYRLKLHGLLAEKEGERDTKRDDGVWYHVKQGLDRLTTTA